MPTPKVLTLFGQNITVAMAEDFIPRLQHFVKEARTLRVEDIENGLKLTFGSGRGGFVGERTVMGRDDTFFVLDRDGDITHGPSTAQDIVDTAMYSKA